MSVANRILDEVFASVDGEFDGSVPFRNSMINFGVVLFTLRKGFIAEFEANLEEWPGASPEPKTMSEFWALHPDAYAYCRKDPMEPRDALWQMIRFVSDHVGEKTAVFAGYPAPVDFAWMYCYLGACGLPDIYRWQAFDLKSYAMRHLLMPFRDTVKKQMPEHWFEWAKTRNWGLPHTGLSDARLQASIMIAAMCEAHAIPNPLLTEANAA